MKNYQIKKAEVSDIQELKNLEQKCFDLTIRENFEFVLNSDSHLYFVVKDNKESIVAYAGISISYEQGDILSVCVDPLWRKQGLAKELLLALLEEAKRRSVNDIFLEVEEDNIPAINLYNKLGFETISKRKNYYGNKTARIMKKDL